MAQEAKGIGYQLQLAADAKDSLKSRMQENRKYGSEEGRRQQCRPPTQQYMRRRDMGKKSTKENKTKYHLVREELGWSREYASEQMGMITPERLERIENEKVTPDPKEILVMAETYGRPSLCNYYCSQKCPIGQQYVPEIEIKELSSIVLEMLASLNSVNKRKDRLIEITADGKIDKDEMDDFIFIQEELERISITVETLQLWSEKMLANGVIDAEAYHARKRK